MSTAIQALNDVLWSKIVDSKFEMSSPEHLMLVRAYVAALESISGEKVAKSTPREILMVAAATSAGSLLGAFGGAGIIAMYTSIREGSLDRKAIFYGALGGAFAGGIGAAAYAGLSMQYAHRS
jgi:hypothetical protein